MENEPVTCLHLVDGSIILGVVNRDPLQPFVTVKNPLILTKAKPLGLDTVKAVLMRYTTFSDEDFTEVKFYLNGMISEYLVSENVNKFYRDFLEAINFDYETDQPDEETSGMSSSVKGLIEKMRESMQSKPSEPTPSTLDIDEIRKILSGDDDEADED